MEVALNHNIIPNDILNNLKHQIILPRHHPITYLLILHNYKSNHHHGRGQALALLREMYWIVEAKYLFGKFLSACLIRKHYHSMPKPQLMENLPKERIAVNIQIYVNHHLLLQELIVLDQLLSNNTNKQEHQTITR